MCLANKFLTRFEELSNELEEEYQRLLKLRSEYDKKLSAHYHKVETAKFNAAEGFYLTKELQDITRQRRMIKTELFKMNNIRNTLKLESVIQSTNKARKSLTKIHKNVEENEWYKEWKDDYRVEDLLVH
ncbi:MAG: hypothetical protein ACI35O_10330 [Bacillaceae bacterium]